MSSRHSPRRRATYSQRRKDCRTRPRPEAPEPALALPYAAKLQGEQIMGDLGLLAGARLRHDRIRWWWGERKLNEWHGAYCYLCDRPITEWDTRYPITESARADILDHRDGHLARTIPTPGTSTAATLAAGDATPAGGQ